MKKEHVPQWEDKGTYKEPAGGDAIRVPQLQIDDATTYIDKDGSNNMTFTDAVSGTQTLAGLVGGGGGTLVSLTDTPANYTAAAYKPVAVNSAGTGVEFATEIYLAPKAASTGPEGTMFYDSDDDHVYVATE